MGLNNITLDFLPKALKVLEVDSWKGIKMLEYGNQIYKGKGSWKTSKEYFKSLGADHVSVDINGKDGALPLDLRQSISGIGEPFDIVTNFGTTEHIRGDQYHAFKNMHDLIRVGGVIISVVPAIGYKLGHGNYHYTDGFFDSLAFFNGWDVHESYIKTKSKKRELVLFLASKQGNIDFMGKTQFNKLLKERVKKTK